MSRRRFIWQTCRRPSPAARHDAVELNAQPGWRMFAIRGKFYKCSRGRREIWCVQRWVD